MLVDAEKADICHRAVERGLKNYYSAPNSSWNDCWCSRLHPIRRTWRVPAPALRVWKETHGRAIAARRSGISPKREVRKILITTKRFESARPLRSPIPGCGYACLAAKNDPDLAARLTSPANLIAGTYQLLGRTRAWQYRRTRW
jgi:hypothetical protein